MYLFNLRLYIYKCKKSIKKTYYPILVFFDSGSFNVTRPLRIRRPVTVNNGIKQLISTAKPNRMLPRIAPKRPATY